MRVLSESDEKKFLFPRTYIETPYGKIDFGLPTLATLYFFEQFIKEELSEGKLYPLRWLAIWYLTGSLRINRKYEGKYIYELSLDEIRNIIGKTAEKLSKIPVDETIHEQLNELGYAMKLPSIEGHFDTDADGDSITLLGSLLNKGFTKEQVMRMTLQEAYMRAKSLIEAHKQAKRFRE